MVELWRTVPEGAREVPPGGHCPKCRSPRVHRSRARGRLEAVARTLSPFRPFSCSGCGWRGWAWPDASQGPVHPLPPLPDVRHRKSKSSGRKGLSPAEIAKQRYRRHVIAAALFAAMSGGALLYCQQEPDPAAEAP